MCHCCAESPRGGLEARLYGDWVYVCNGACLVRLTVLWAPLGIIGKCRRMMRRVWREA